MAVSKKSYGGRPPKFKTKEEIQDKIDEYFLACEGVPYLDEEGRPLRTDRGEILYQKAPKPPTVTGLALALGFFSRQALINYQAKKEFRDTITRAKLICEEYAERRLFDRDGVNGAKFSLINNFKGWSDKPVQDEKDKTNSDMLALAEILTRPGRERDLKDFEEPDGK